MNERSRLCTLEALNTDVLIAILAACDSLSDLASFFRASPTLLHAFLSAKAAVLLHVVSNFLGPATRDAALLAQISRFDDEDYERKVHAAVQDYRARLHVASAPWVTRLDADAAVALTRVTRLAQFFVDLFGYFHFRHFAHELHLTQANPQPRLCRTEHGRIAQAVLRRQLLVHMRGGRLVGHRYYPQFVRAAFSLFLPWELEQISDMDQFMDQLLESLGDYQMKKRGPNGERDAVDWLVDWRYWSVHYASDLEGFAMKLKSALDLDSSLLDRLCREEGGNFSERVRVRYFRFDMFHGSHRFTTPPSLYSEQQLASDIAAAEFGQETSTSSQPWAWKDALGGHETCRWGYHLVKAPPSDSANQQDYYQAKSALKSWRRFGMVFWTTSESSS